MRHVTKCLFWLTSLKHTCSYGDRPHTHPVVGRSSKSFSQKSHVKSHIDTHISVQMKGTASSD